MKETQILIIGGGAAGTTAAETYRVGGGTGEVLIVTDEAHPLYSRVLLPHAAKGKIGPERAFLKTSEWYREKNIGLLTGRSVLRVDYRHKKAALDDGDEIVFEKLVIAAGARPRAWEVPGAHLPEVLRLQTYEDAVAAKERLAAGGTMSIIGSGFIALEFAAMAIEKKMPATLLNRGPHFWTSALGKETGDAVEAALAAGGVTVRHGTKAEAVLGAERVEGVRLSNGEEIPCDTIGLGIGVEMPMEPFGDLRGEHGLLADRRLRAVHDNVWIAGDCAEFEDEALGGLRHVSGNWTNAIAQGRHVGQALLGRDEPFAVLTSYSTSVVPGVNLIFLGDVRQRPGFERVARVIEPGKKLVEFTLLGGRIVGAVLLNAADQRVPVAALMQISDPDFSAQKDRLANPAFPLDVFR